MRLFPVVKSGMNRNKKSGAVFALVAMTGLVPLLFPLSSFAQAYVSSVPPLSAAVPRTMQAPPYGTVNAAYAPSPYGQSAGTNRQQSGTQQSYMNALSSMQQRMPGSGSSGSPDISGNMPQSSSPLDSSQAAKVNRLAEKAEQQRAETATFDQQDIADKAKTDELGPPPDMTALQQVNTYQAATVNSLADDPVSKGLSLDMRRDAQKEAALSYGARGGLAKRNFEIMERMKGFETVLDRVFDFRALLLKAPSGLLIEPPIIKESRDAVVVTNNGDEAAVADSVFDINKKAKIVTAPRDWRQYLIQSWSRVPPPPRILWPKTAKEQAEWDAWVAQGWEAGTEQADQIFEANVNQLVAEYNGMVRYKMLLAQEMISAPYAMHEDRGVTGDTNQMRVGDRAVRITGPSQFLTKADLWKPANQ